ncbi:homoprotocatechuate degradation operon regulator HpaR [Ruegeria pomeroyi]|uniref:homoprotocatechuate degradation operon regulator HpaR n=1 Tax=Ruegeria pomeroyi TaxID=89184 RepID=UPI001F41DD49|nr:homoprotocatechuate degradation operon regulator HpaR [Ruegeria pomeroyi]MCE8508598.1 homoprotocatechuate degradation operon regulator HpaR [Ruegeria pomeroyi]MCE8515110.1 homoprotocatechuate degradation operon regulator HpaR [Ruegeria pomeroyi]MCE8524516.1 homoprotocatechuate degradation operon regulator HpaR [Ruegeria pomeroyi]MCE8556539.1 homoprotocatechuate degradation operon regulator HpaR [Ruegeria pomeroyi]
MSSDLPKTSRSLPIALLRARERVMRPVRAILMDVGITEQQWRVLRVLEEEGPQDPTRIADGACLLLPSLTRILQKLEEKQLISRQPDPDDGRKQVVSITQAGTQIIRDNLGASQAVFEAIQAQMGADRYEMLLDLLNELHLDKTD